MANRILHGTARTNNLQDNQSYIDKKAKLSKILTIYGRNAVIEALMEPSIIPSKLHLSNSNKSAKVIDDMVLICNKRSVEIAYHDKLTLSRISKNAKQDQGVALDIYMDTFVNEDKFIANNISYRLLAIDGVSNPQNLGMIIRSAAAGNIDAIIIPSKGTSSVNPLVIKASVGTIFKIPIIISNDLTATLKKFKASNALLYTLSLDAKESYADVNYTDKSIFIL